ncbi:GtrA family protein, partial [Streptococcus pneumoniae]
INAIETILAKISVIIIDYNLSKGYIIRK